MKNPWLLSLAPLLLVLAVSSSLPLTAAGVWQRRLIFDRLNPTKGLQSPVVECVGDGVYAANSTYQANLRRVAALLLAEAEVPATTVVGYYTATGIHSYTARDVEVGYWPNLLMATSFCRNRRSDVNDTGLGHRCADCIAGAFLEVERACPYRREASYSSRNCSLELAEIRIFGTDGIFWNILEQAMASGLVFQAIGFGCLFFLLFQEWCSRKRGTLMNSTPLLSRD